MFFFFFLLFLLFVFVFFFFQAEDGIRDLVRSRGLGDVYKRQLLGCPLNGTWTMRIVDGLGGDNGFYCTWAIHFNATDLPDPVSYTHLTLPTSDLV